VEWADGELDRNSEKWTCGLYRLDGGPSHGLLYEWTVEMILKRPCAKIVYVELAFETQGIQN
jgi:hypothetical protein